MATALSAIAGGVGQILGRTLLIQMGTTPPTPLAVLDVVKDEIIDYEAEISEHPVEEGQEISDHVQLKNPTIRLKGVISNTPLDLSIAIANLASGTLAAITSSQARQNLLNTGVSQAVGILGSALQGNAGNLTADAYSGAVDAISRVILLNAYQAKMPFSVITKRQRFDNVVIKRLTFPRNEETGYALAFEMEIKQIRIVKTPKATPNQVTESLTPTASSATDLGSQSTQQASPQAAQAVKNSSLGDLDIVTSKSPGFFA